MTSKTRWRLVGALAALVAITLGLVAFERWHARPAFRNTDITGVDWGRDFRLTDHHGVPRRLADFRGKAVMLFFGYTHCPDVCPVALAQMAQAVRQLGEDGKRVQGLFVTLDPARDTAEVLARFVTSFNPTFLGLYGDQEQTAATVREFKAFHALQKPDASSLYTVDHSARIYVFDRNGRLRLAVSGGGDSLESLAHDLKELLRS